jgi:hypothetical protein
MRQQEKWMMTWLKEVLENFFKGGKASAFKKAVFTGLG